MKLKTLLPIVCFCLAAFGHLSANSGAPFNGMPRLLKQKAPATVANGAVTITNWSDDIVAESLDGISEGIENGFQGLYAFYTSAVCADGAICDAEGNVTSASGCLYNIPATEKNAMKLARYSDPVTANFDAPRTTEKVTLLVFAKASDGIDVMASLVYQGGPNGELQTKRVQDWQYDTPDGTEALTGLGVVDKDYFADAVVSANRNYRLYEIVLAADASRKVAGVELSIDGGSYGNVAYVVGVNAMTDEVEPDPQPGTDPEDKYDYDFKPTVCCGADWYGIRRSEGSHTLNSYYLVLGDNMLDEEGYPVPGSTTYAFDFFGAAPEDEYAPQLPAGTYRLAGEIGENVLFNDSRVYQIDGNGNYEIDRGFIEGHLDVTEFERDGNSYYRYEAFLTDELGKSHHLLYESRFVTFNDLSQASMYLEKDVDYECSYGFAKYRSVDNDVMNIYVELSDANEGSDGNDFSRIPAHQMMIELYMPAGETLADGTYIVNEGDNGAFTLDSGEIVNQYGVQYPVGTYLQYIMPGKYVAWGAVESGSLTVSTEDDEKVIIGEFVTREGFSIKLSYRGELSIDNVPQTGITEDLEMDLEGATAKFECIGDAAKLNNCRNWYITILPTDGKDHGFTSYLNSPTESFFDGIACATNTASPSPTPWKGEYLKGSLNEDGKLSGTWGMTQFDEDNVPVVNAPAKSGDLVISRDTDGVTYTVEFSLNDGIGHDFHGKWTGVPELINSCGDEESGIENIQAAEGETVVAIYNVNGIRVNDMSAAGLYIIRYSDGTTAKKVVR